MGKGQAIPQLFCSYSSLFTDEYSYHFSSKTFVFVLLTFGLMCLLVLLFLMYDFVLFCY